ncbi:MAG: Ig-like domain-containing protein, partial [Ilumatobacteraceae bacterium]
VAGTARQPYEVADPDGASATGTVTVDVIADDSPPPATDDDVTVYAGTTETLDVLSNDDDREDESLTIVAVKPPSVGEVVLTANSVTYHAPSDTDGQTAFAYVVEDSNGGRGEATVHVTILSPRPADLPPAAPPPPAGPIARDDQATVQEDSGELDLDLVANDGASGEDLSRHTIALTNAAQLGSAQLVGHELRYRPNADANGTDSLTYALCDTRGRCDAATVTVTILAANDPPQFVAAGAVSTTEDYGLTAVAGWVSAISPGAANESGQNVGFTVVVDQPSLFASLPAVGSSGTLTFTPAPDAYGTSTITVTARDDGGTANGGADTSSPRLAVITVTPVNDPPEFTDGGAVVTGEDNGPTLVNGWATSITPGPADESAQTTSFTTTTDQPALFATAPSVDAAGALSFTPAPNAHGSASITVTAVDDGGTADGGDDTSAAHTSTITVTPVNDPVVAAGDSATVAEDTIAGVTIDVLANDTDVDGDALAVSSFDTTGIAGGVVIDQGGGTFNYTPDPNFNGTETFSYTATDGQGSTVTATATIVVTPTPDAPVATADAYATAEDTPLVITAPGVLANDYDEDGDTLTIAPTPLTLPAHGIVVLGGDGAFTYTPTTGYVGTDSFTYEVDDGTGSAATGTVTITVDSGITTAGLYLGHTSTLGVWNMTTAPPAIADPEPDYDLDGNAGITVAKDGILSTETWARTVSGSPLVLNGPVTVELWSTIEDFRTDKDGHPDITLYDCDGLGLVCVAVAHTDTHMKDYNGGVADWVKVDVSLGNITHTFAVGRRLRVDIREKHDDLWIAATGSRPSRLMYTLANTAPVAVADTAPVTLEDAAGPTTIAVLANDSDDNLDVSSLSITGAPSKGTATPQADGSIDYQPDPDASGADSFTYQICDTSGLCSTATVAINITPVNDAPDFIPGADLGLSSSDPPFSQPGWATGITAGPADEAAQTLTFSVTATNPGLFATQPAIDATGRLTFTLSGSVGSTTINIQLNDSGGTANGGDNTSPTRSATITVS